MKAIAIFTHALRMVLGNAGAALRLGAVALVVMVALDFSIGREMILSPVPEQQMMPSPAVLFLSLARIVTGLWVAVAWHRYILIEETPGAFLPPWHGAAIWRYVKAGVILGLVLAAVFIPLMAVSGLILTPMMGATSASPGMLVVLIGFLVVFLPAGYVFYRLAPILPAAAIGTRLTLREAWFQTSTGGGAIFGLTLISVLASWLVQIPGALLGQISAPLGLLCMAVAQWLVMLVGVSIMTTLYGHYIEKRDLNA